MTATIRRRHCVLVDCRRLCCDRRRGAHACEGRAGIGSRPERAPYFDGTKRWYDATEYGRAIYRRRHVRKRIPKPSTSTESRPQGTLGYLWTNYGGTLDSWEKHPITKITAKRIWTANTNRYRAERQHSFDRAKLESKGRVHGWYTEAAKEAEQCKQREREDRWRGQWRAKHGDEPYPQDVYRNNGNGHFPLLALTSPFTKRDVLRQFRRLSLQHHPDSRRRPCSVPRTGGRKATGTQAMFELERAEITR